MPFISRIRRGTNLIRPSLDLYRLLLPWNATDSCEGGGFGGKEEPGGITGEETSVQTGRSERHDEVRDQQ